MEWLEWMKSHYGEIEWTGQKPTHFIEECFKHTNYGELHGSTPPACAATLCAALEETGYRSTKNAAAVSYAKYGDPCELKPGAIVVFQWGTGDHHVSICESFDEQTVTCCGGNQGHNIRNGTYERRWVIAIRWPVKQ